MAAKRDIELEYMTEKLNSVYKERNMCVSLIARLSSALGLEVGVKAHEGQPHEWDAEWQNVLFVKLPSGQVSWHLRESDLKFFKGIPDFTELWDFHDTETKYERVLNPQLELLSKKEIL
jgi:hypothetical protein